MFCDYREHTLKTKQKRKITLHYFTFLGEYLKKGRDKIKRRKAKKEKKTEKDGAPRGNKRPPFSGW